MEQGLVEVVGDADVVRVNGPCAHASSRCIAARIATQRWQGNWGQLRRDDIARLQIPDFGRGLRGATTYGSNRDGRFVARDRSLRLAPSPIQKKGLADHRTSRIRAT